MDSALIYHFALATGLGLLVGFQRQIAESQIAGIRTFTIIAMWGATSGLLSQRTTNFVLPAGAIALAIILLIANLHKYRLQKFEPGITTEVAALLVYSISAAIMYDYIHYSILVTGVLVLLLYLKQKMHQFVARVGTIEIKLIMQFVLISLIILPLMPNKNYGPFHVFNPFQTWKLVVIIVAINLASFLIYKLFAARVGVLLAGIFGGLISSTATTVSYSRQTKMDSNEVPISSAIILFASTVTYVRILLEIYVSNPSAFLQISPLILQMFAWMLIVTFGTFLTSRHKLKKPLKLEDPVQLKTAIAFAFLFALVSLIAAFTKSHFGDRWLYTITIFSGLSDVDAITLATSRMVFLGQIDTSLGGRLIMVSSLANLFFKLCLCFIFGSKKHVRYMLIPFGLILLGGMILLWANPFST